MFDDIHGFESIINVYDGMGDTLPMEPMQSIQQDILQSMIDSQQAKLTQQTEKGEKQCSMKQD